MVAKRTTGKDFNFFQKVTVSETTFPDDSQISINVKVLNNLLLVNEGSNVVEYSFNGNTVHGDLTPSSTTESLLFNNRRVSAIWFRTATGSNVVRVEAW